MHDDGSTWIKYLSWQDSSVVADVKARGQFSEVHRKRVLEVLVSLLPPNVLTHFSARIVGVSNVPASDGREEHARLVIATPKSGRDCHAQEQQQTWTFEADAVIGADGIRSVVRELIDVDAQVRWTGSSTYRSLLSMERVKQVNGEFPDAAMWMGPGKVTTFSRVQSGDERLE
jgi:2-polyprenyl-6-methoxyphenol hydroxylase-like FAD-dependent oxidoreductase